MSERNTSYITCTHITIEINLTGRTQRSTHQLRVYDSLQWTKTLHHPKNLLFYGPGRANGVPTNSLSYSGPNQFSRADSDRVNELTRILNRPIYGQIYAISNAQKPTNRPKRDRRLAYSLNRTLFGLARDQRTSNLSQYIYTIKLKNSKNFESLLIIWVLKSEKTFKMSF